MHQDKNHAKKRRSKRETAPYVWEVPPQDGLTSIFSVIAGVFASYDQDTGKLKFAANEMTLKYYNCSEDWVMKLINRYNAGEKWIEISEMT